MGNVLNIAKKEFGDLLNDRIILVVIIVYLLYLLIILTNMYNLFISGFYDEDPGIYGFDPIANLAGSIMDQYTLTLSRYGALLGIAVGFLSISGERHGGALNVLVSKPLYRDTIITGKMIGSLLFLLCIFTLVSIFLTSGVFIICGSTLVPIMGECLARIPIALVTALLYVLVFFFVAMIISILIKNYAFSLILGLLAWNFSELMKTMSITGFIALYLGDLDGITSFFWDISPDGIIRNISYNALEDFSVNYFGCISLAGYDLAKLLIYVIVLMFMSYTVFLRSDIS